MEPQADTHRETSDVNIRAILGFGAGLVVAAAIIHLLIWLLFGFFQSREAQSATRQFPLAAEQQNRLPPEPRLQTDPRGEMRDLRQRDETVLRSYGWVNKDAGVVRLPIEDAMKLTIQRGLPARQAETR
jgi:hypothetical protein